MSLLVDTSVWSLALRRDLPSSSREVEALETAITQGETICLTGIILQEVLQGFESGDRTRRLTRQLAPFPLLDLDRADFVHAAEIRNRCRSKGIQVSTIDAQIAAAAIDHGCSLLTADHDFKEIARHFPLELR